MNILYAHLVFVLMYSLVIVGLFIVMRSELKKIQKEMRGEKE